MSIYRLSAEYRAAVTVANAQRANMRFRVGTLDNVTGVPCVIRTRHEVRS
jgi:hypothetical protein